MMDTGFLKISKTHPNIGRKHEEEKEMHKYLDENVDPSFHELLRTNVVTATRNYDHRVRHSLEIL